ncbi:MAG: cell division protein FtsA [Mediterranea sp.]|jgi:cell division protein FtsA|nr:cell division protein FtsA [Mediterranea sp.]
MATTEFIAAIELGSSKIVGAAGRKNNDGSMQILAYVQEDSSSFIRKGTIFNVDKATQGLTTVIQQLEKELNSGIAKVYVGIGGQSLRTVRNVVTRELKEEAIITEELVSAIGDENTAVPLINMDILEVAPQEYKVENNLQANPVGLLGSHIEGRFLNIVARSAVKKNLEYCFHQAKIGMADLLISPIVTATALLTENERRSGCALVDFGADTTTLVVYKNDILRYLAVLPLGGNNITRDLTTLNIEEEEAERLKKRYGDACYEEDPEQEPALCERMDGGHPIKVAELNNIIEARAEEIVANVWHQLQLSGYEEKLMAGVVFTGGAANLKNLDEMVRKRQKVEKLRTAKVPRETIHASGEAQRRDGSQNTLYGLLLSGELNCARPEMPKTPPTTTPTSSQTPELDFGNDPEWEAEQERLKEEKRKKDEEERKRQKEQDEKRRRKEESKRKPSWIDRFARGLFDVDDDSSKMEDDK